jgi:peptidoglycan/LPS O-acetylase OafA/YrhL
VTTRIAHKANWICVLAAVGVSFVFFVLSCIVYTDTPPDAQKPVGYIFIAIYWLMFAVVVFVFGRLLFLVPEARKQPSRLIALLAVACLVGIIAVGMVLRHRHDLFPKHPTSPNQPMQPTASPRTASAFDD